MPKSYGVGRVRVKRHPLGMPLLKPTSCDLSSRGAGEVSERPLEGWLDAPAGRVKASGQTAEL